jgi:hypothetical protein
MPFTTATIELEIPEMFIETITTNGPTTVARGTPIDPGDGHIKIDTEIVSMSLTGMSTHIGPITIIESPSETSNGTIRQETSGVDFPADSFFDVFVEIQTTLPFPMNTLHNDDPCFVNATIYSIPPWEVNYTGPPEPVPLKDEQNNTVAFIRHVSHEIPPAHDIAISAVAASKTVVGQGCLVVVNATIGNLGSFDETFNVTAYANTAMIGTRELNLTTGNSTTLTFTWSTTGFAYGNYIVSAYAWPIPGETNIVNNNCTGGMIKITIPGDLNGDFKVTLQDLVLLANAYGSKPGDTKWNPNADINGDGKVSLADLVLMATHYGQHYP